MKQFPDEVLASLRGATLAILEVQAAADPMSAKFWASQMRFLETVRTWTAVGAQSLVDHR